MDELHRCWDCIREVIIFVLPPALIGMFGSLVRYLRKHRHEPFSWGAFLTGMITAGFIGVLMSCLGTGIGLPPLVVSAMVGMSGYCGGQVLDLGQSLLMRWLEKRVR
jgi:fluoride ion exporter CrcB/FEX